MLTRPNVIVANSDPGLRRLLRRHFTGAGFTVAEASLGQEVIELAGRVWADLTILAIDFPDTGGTDLIRRMRELTGEPILVLLREPSPLKAASALDAGADDSMAEPFSMEELAARARRLLLRAGTIQDAVSLMTGGGRLETAPSGDSVLIDSRPVALTRREAHLLGLLIAARGATVGHDAIVRKIWGQDGSASRQNLRRVVGSLRRKLEADPARPRVIVSVRGGGYRITVISDARGSPPQIR